MVILIPGLPSPNPNPTRAEIDTYMSQCAFNSRYLDTQNTSREIQCKSAMGALLHPADEYFLASAMSNHRINI